MILHDQRIDFTKPIKHLEDHVRYLGYPKHAIHTGPLIRRESIYSNDSIEIRRTLFNALFHFARKQNFHYLCPIIKKRECADTISLTAKLSQEISNALRSHYDYLKQFDTIIVYYDNGQIELTKILTSVFHTLFSNVTFRKVQPADYTLFQVADLMCTVELLAQKAEAGSFSRSEANFFGSPKNFRKNILKYLTPKRL